MDGIRLAEGTVAGKGSFQGGEGNMVEMRVGEYLAEVGWSVEVHNGGV